MLDPSLLRTIADQARAMRASLSAALAVADPIEQLLAAGPSEDAHLTAVIRAETHLAHVAIQLDRAALLAAAESPQLVAEVLPMRASR